MNPEDQELPEWERPEEEIPPALEKKWQSDEESGLAADVCSKCRTPYTEHDLSCPGCGALVEVSPKSFPSFLKKLRFGPWSVITLIIIGCIVFSLIFG